jgi:hypothetical protein
VETIARLEARPEPPPPPRRDRPTFSLLAFAAGDSWVATPSGRLAIVRASAARVEWIEPGGRRVIGPPIRWQPVPVTARDRSDFVRQMLATSGTSDRGGVDRPPGGLGPVSADQMTDQAVAQMVANMTFAKEKAAFTDAAPIVAPDGTLWVERSVAAGARSIWILFDAAGRPSGSWQLPAGRRLVGVGRGRVYLVSADDDGIERLERYAVPR